MKAKLIVYPLLALLTFCQSKKDPALQLLFDLENVDESSELKLYNLSYQIGRDLINPIGGFFPDSSGVYTIRLDSVEFGVYAIKVNDQSLTTLVLYDGVDMNIKGDMTRPNGLIYTGEGAGESQFYKDFNVLSQRGMMEFIKEDEQNFVKKLDSAFQSGMEQLKMADSLNSRFIELEEAILKARRGEYVNHYPKGRQWVTKAKEEIQLADSLQTYKDEAIAASEIGMLAPEYQGIIADYHRTAFQKVSEAYWDEHPDESWNMEKQVKMRMEYILEKEDEALKDYLLAAFSMEAITIYGDKAHEIVYEAHKENFPASDYRAYLDEAKKKWELLAKGNPALEIEGMAPDSSKVKLSDYKGKVVYLDTWATWCGPCRKEFPLSKALKKEYKDKENIVFMYASIDRDREDWEKFLKNDPELKGVHFIVDGAWRSKLCNDYLIRSIPRYILFDKEGKIANAWAPRPSSGKKIRNEIDTLLLAKHIPGK